MKKEDVEEYYEDTTKWSSYVNSKMYGKYFKTQEAIIIEIISNRIEDPKSKKLLDAGCGYGRYTKKFFKMGFEVYAIDISQNMVNNVKEICEDIEVGDLCSTKFEDNFFDIVTCIDVFDHLESIEDAIFEFKRILKKGGILLVTITNRRSILYGLNKFLRLIFKIFRINYGTPISKGYSREELEDILKNNFGNYYVVPVNYLLPLPVQFIGVADSRKT